VNVDGRACNKLSGRWKLETVFLRVVEVGLGWMVVTLVRTGMGSGSIELRVNR